MVHLGTAGRLLAIINGHFFVKFSREFANKSALYENNSLSYCNKSALYGNKSLSYCNKSALYENNSLSYCNKSALFGINLFLVLHWCGKKKVGAPANVLGRRRLSAKGALGALSFAIYI